jgi:hypothetical protein
LYRTSIGPRFLSPAAHRDATTFATCPAENLTFTTANDIVAIENTNVTTATDIIVFENTSTPYVIGIHLRGTMPTGSTTLSPIITSANPPSTARQSSQNEDEDSQKEDPKDTHSSPPPPKERNPIERS